MRKFPANITMHRSFAIFLACVKWRRESNEEEEGCRGQIIKQLLRSSSCQPSLFAHTVESRSPTRTRRERASHIFPRKHTRSYIEIPARERRRFPFHHRVFWKRSKEDSSSFMISRTGRKLSKWNGVFFSFSLHYVDFAVPARSRPLLSLSLSYCH